MKVAVYDGCYAIGNKDVRQVRTPRAQHDSGATSSARGVRLRKLFDIWKCRLYIERMFFDIR